MSQTSALRAHYRRGRSPYSSPFNVVPFSIDLPYRFGPDAITKIYPGSVISDIVRRTHPGWSCDRERVVGTGPAKSDDPRAITRRISSRISSNGSTAAHADRIVRRTVDLGGLKESDYFNTDPTDNVSSLSAFSHHVEAERSSGLTLGIQRSVYAPVDGYGGVAAKRIRLPD